MKKFFFIQSTSFKNYHKVQLKKENYVLKIFFNCAMQSILNKLQEITPLVWIKNVFFYKSPHIKIAGHEIG